MRFEKIFILKLAQPDVVGYEKIVDLSVSTLFNRFIKRGYLQNFECEGIGDHSIFTIAPIATIRCIGVNLKQARSVPVDSTLPCLVTNMAKMACDFDQLTSTLTQPFVDGEKQSQYFGKNWFGIHKYSNEKIVPASIGIYLVFHSEPGRTTDVGEIAQIVINFKYLYPKSVLYFYLDACDVATTPTGWSKQQSTLDRVIQTLVNAFNDTIELFPVGPLFLISGWSGPATRDFEGGFFSVYPETSKSYVTVNCIPNAVGHHSRCLNIMHSGLFSDRGARKIATVNDPLNYYKTQTEKYLLSKDIPRRELLRELIIRAKTSEPVAEPEDIHVLSNDELDTICTMISETSENIPVHQRYSHVLILMCRHVLTLKHFAYVYIAAESIAECPICKCKMHRIVGVIR